MPPRCASASSPSGPTAAPSPTRWWPPAASRVRPMAHPKLGFTFASLMPLGPGLAVETAQQAKSLGYRSFWTAETTGPEAFSLLAAAGAAAPGLDLGTGVLALQLRTPMVAAMGAA